MKLGKRGAKKGGKTDPQSDWPVRADGKKALGGRFRKHQRTETLEARPHHPELEGAYALLVNAKHAQSQTLHKFPE